MLLAVILMTGRPSVFTDTDDYYIQGQKVARYAGQILHVQFVAPENPEDLEDPATAVREHHMGHTELGARSAYYGTFVYVLEQIGTLWLLAAAQCAIGAWLIYLLWRAVSPGAAHWTYLTLMGALTLGTAFPLFAGFAIPDIFSAYAVMDGVLLLVFWDRLGKWEKVALWVLLAASLSFHTSHLLTAAAMGVMTVGLLWLLRAPRPARAPLGWLALAAVVALVANALPGMATKAVTGDELRRPPFLTARLVADGPGHAYLNQACVKGNEYDICRFRNLPLKNSEDFLWSDDAGFGVFNRSGAADRIRMEKEEYRFAVGTLFYDPVWLAKSSAINWGLQIVRVKVNDPLRDVRYFFTNDYWKTTWLPILLNRMGDCGADGIRCVPRLDPDGIRPWYEGILLASLALMAWRLAQGDVRRSIARRDLTWDRDLTRMLVMLVLLIGAVVVNAAVCGILSGPYSRYQARIAWLAPLAAGLAVMRPAPAGAREGFAQMLQRLRAHPLYVATAGRIDPSFLRFGVVGVVGFSVDFLVLHGLVTYVGFNYFTGRLVSFSVAVAVTWLLNRSWTFRHGQRRGRLSEALIYVAVQGAGGVANIATYTAAIALVPVLKHYLIAPLAMGSAVGLCLTFLGAKHLAFRARRAPAPAE